MASGHRHEATRVLKDLRTHIEAMSGGADKTTLQADFAALVKELALVGWVLRVGIEL